LVYFYDWFVGARNKLRVCLHACMHAYEWTDTSAYQYDIRLPAGMHTAAGSSLASCEGCWLLSQIIAIQSCPNEPSRITVSDGTAWVACLGYAHLAAATPTYGRSGVARMDSRTGGTPLSSYEPTRMVSNARPGTYVRRCIGSHTHTHTHVSSPRGGDCQSSRPVSCSACPHSLVAQTKLRHDPVDAPAGNGQRRDQGNLRQSIQECPGQPCE
jgi:hypothetical protein